LQEKLVRLFKDNFLRGVTTLASGTIIGQILVILASPFLSRIYQVESFGNLAIFTSVTAFLAVVSTGRYELAIGLPKSKEDSYRIIKLIVIIGGIVSFIYLLLIIVLKYMLKVLDKDLFLSQNIYYLAPFYIFSVAVFSALNYWKQRQKAYKTITIATTLQIISTTLGSLILGFFNVKSGLILSLMLGMLVGISYHLLTERKIVTNVMKQGEVKSIALQYSSFPKYMTFSDLSLVASQQFIPIIFSLLYSTTVVGFFSMANRIIRIPNIVITSAISNVFRNEAIDAIRVRGNCKDLYFSTMKKLIFLSLPAYLFLFLTSKFLFSWIFGKQWYVAGEYSQVISVFLFFEFIATPLSSVYYIRGKQKLLMKLQLLNAVLGFIMILVGYLIFSDAYMSLVFFAISASVFNIILIFNSYKISKTNNAI